MANPVTSFYPIREELNSKHFSLRGEIQIEPWRSSTRRIKSLEDLPSAERSVLKQTSSAKQIAKVGKGSPYTKSDLDLDFVSIPRGQERPRTATPTKADRRKTLSKYHVDLTGDTIVDVNISFVALSNFLAFNTPMSKSANNTPEGAKEKLKQNRKSIPDFLLAELVNPPPPPVYAYNNAALTCLL
jgi:hypothetical protein